MTLRNALVAATMLALPFAVNAQPINGLYVGGAASINIMEDETISSSKATSNLEAHVGPAVSLSLGYGLGNGLRAELEGNYRENSFYGVSGGSVAAGGQEQKGGVMANVLYDFYGASSMVVPYVGIGAGYQWTKETDLHLASPGFLATANDSTKGSFAYQAILGAAMPLAGVPGLSLTADYRFMGLAGDRTYDGFRTLGIHTVASSATLSSDYNHAIMVGFRYAFGVAPLAVMAPAPAAVAPSPVSRSYLVFFDWDKAELTARAKAIVSEAAANSTKVQYTRLEVNGYTDTSGTPQYNQGLSIRRAQVVAAELVKDGVPKSAISIHGFGETHLLVQTGAGVREPQNRRVEIIIK